MLKQTAVVGECGSGSGSASASASGKLEARGDFECHVTRGSAGFAGKGLDLGCASTLHIWRITSRGMANGIVHDKFFTMSEEVVSKAFNRSLEGVVARGWHHFRIWPAAAWAECHDKRRSCD